jgi:hypothetical protein
LIKKLLKFNFISRRVEMNAKSMSINDKKVIKDLAKRYMEIACLDEMSRRKELWRKLHDLKPERPMILFEPYSLESYLSDYNFKCEDPELRNVETRFVYNIRQYEQLGDDIVFEPYFRLAWWDPELLATGKKFGEVEIKEHHAAQDSMAYLSNFPIKSPADLEKLSPRKFTINRKPTLDLKTRLEEIFGNILPVRIGNFDNFVPDIGNQFFTGNNFIGITWDVFKLIGAERMMLWAFDHPASLHELCKFLVDDRKRFYDFLYNEKLLDFNSDNQFAGPSSYGYVSGLPTLDSEKELELKDLWCWPESQEAEPFSPAMFDEFFLPSIAEIANMFGMSYYGCCERITDRFEFIAKAIPNLRTVSISGWSDFREAGEMLGNNYVYSRKPVPAYTSSETPNWDLVEKEAAETKKATKNGSVEIIFRDFYSSNITPGRAAELVKRWKKVMCIY